MGTVSEEMMKDIGKYMVKLTLVINVILLLCHICFGVVFYIYDTTIIFYYNFISILIYMVAFELLRRGKSWTYVFLIYIEIFIFMIMSVICFGWEYGFQQWSMGFITTTVFVDFILNRQYKIRNFTKAVVAFDVLAYVLLRIFTYHQPYIYRLESEMLAHVFCIVNALIGFTFMITYSLIYMNTVRKLEKELLNMASIDALTGMKNRRGMQELLNAVFEGYTEHSCQMCVAIIDIDHFKKVNDTYGHDVGDEVLKALTEVFLKRHEREENFHVSRWGGEEFLVFYKKYHKSREEVIQEFELLRQQIQDMTIRNEDSDIRITITVGVAFYDEDSTVQSLIKEADNNLYIGKESGRNKVVYEKALGKAGC